MIRRAEKKDIPRIMKLLQEVAAVHHEARPDLFLPGKTKYTVPELEGILMDPKTPVFVYADGMDVVQGYAVCILEDHSESHVLTPIRTLYIDDLCVEEAAREKKIGSRLFDYVKNYAREQGCYNLTLNVWEGNDSAKAFYLGRGMQVQKTGMEVIL